VLNPADQDSVSCGSFFTNPIVSDRFARTLPATAPRWETPEDDGLTVKLSAAWLIEDSGIPKGFALPGSKAAISSKHTLAITNRGGATAQEIRQLAEFVQARVSNQFGIILQAEPNLVGF
jgi:UDP-N-acetylmuramate dehydrogenase